MSLKEHYGSWQNQLDRGWADAVQELKRAAASPKTTYGTLVGYANKLLMAAVVRPEDVRAKLPALASALDRVVARAATEMVGQKIAPAFIRVLDLGNALACSGCPIADATNDVFRDWLARMELTRDAPAMDANWSAGFAALVLDEQPTYRRLAARAGGATLPFTAGETFGFNVQALLGHLAAAVETGASLMDVTPAWHELLGNYDVLYDGSSIRPSTLLWIARVVHHRIGGSPLGDVGQRLREDILNAASTP